jgi:hypothetical protein
VDNAGKLECLAINELRLKALAACDGAACDGGAGDENRTRVLSLGSGSFARALITKNLKN